MAITATMAGSGNRPAPLGDEGSEPFPQLLAVAAERWPTKVAVIDGPRRLTFAEWHARSAGLAASLSQRGVGRGDVVSYQLPNWWEAAVVFSAVAQLGAIVHPILPIFRQRELRFVLQQSGSKAIFVPHEFRGVDYPALLREVAQDLPELDHVVAVRGDNSFDAMAQPQSVSATSRVAPQDLLLLMYTSGTTADPKGVLHTHQTLTSEIHSLERIHQLSASDSTLMPSPLTHISGVLHGIMSPAMIGTTAVFMDRWDAARGAELIAQHQITYMVGAPLFLQDLIATRPGQQPSSLRLFSCGGASVSPDLMRQARAVLGCVAKRVYGSTEFPTMTTTDADDAMTHGITTEGRPIPPNRIRIVDEAGRQLGADEAGEIQAIGPELFVGYADQQLNTESFAADGWFRTGDIGSVDRDGYLTVTGRLKQIIIRKGEKISIREVEDALGRHPDVTEVCVVGVADPDLGERACAVIVRRNTELTADELLQFLTEQGLARQKLPEQIRFEASLPRTDSGKVHRAAVTALFERS